MTVKVIGQDPKLAKQVTCRHCGAVNEYLPIDVRELNRGRDIDGGMSISEGFNCGQCHHEIITRAW
jgi:transcription elongation factor Elf1